MADFNNAQDSETEVQNGAVEVNVNGDEIQTNLDRAYNKPTVDELNTTYEDMFNNINYYGR